MSKELDRTVDALEKELQRFDALRNELERWQRKMDAINLPVTDNRAMPEDDCVYAIRLVIE
jgi:hypothetical protein